MTANRKSAAKTIFASLLLVVVVIGIGAGLGWHKYQSILDASQQGPPPEMPEVVSIVPANMISFRPTVTAVGTIRAPRSITLRNEIAGQVVSIPLQSGQIVEQGDVLVVLDRSVEDAQLLSAKARQRMANSMLERTRRSANANASSDNEVDQAEAEMSQADAEIARLKAIIEKKTLTAPFRAKAGLVDTHPGQYLSEGTEITTLQGIDDHVHVDFMMPQEVADSVELGQTVRLLLNPSPMVATVIALDSLADRSTRNLLGRARLDHPPGHLQPNDSVKVEVAYGAEQTTIAVPAEAVRRAPTGAFVFVAEPDQDGILRAAVRPILPAQTIGRDVVVYRGIQADEPIIVDGSFKLREGVMIVGMASPTGGVTSPEKATDATAATTLLDAAR